MRYLAVLVPLILLAACGQSSAPVPPIETPIAASSPSPEAAEEAPRQRIYETWLDFNRDFVMQDPVLACDPLNWEELSASAGETSVIYELSLIDACHEAGELPGLIEWSAYYADAIGP